MYTSTMTRKLKSCEDCGIPYPYLQKAHILAKYKGGTKTRDNILLLCPNCHYMRDHDERIERLEARWTPEERKKQSERSRKWWTETPPQEIERRNMSVSKQMQGNKNGIGNSGPSRIGWGNGLEACSDCGTQDKPHKAWGLCNACFLRAWRAATGKNGHSKAVV